MTSTTSTAMTFPRDRILEKARSVVKGYAAAREHWNPASSLSSLLRQMQREYEGRFLYELIQNAYDAHGEAASGDIVVLLDLDEGEHGVLYVANGGAPFTEANFEAICELAQSDKAPDESIGNKGVGFKSVLQVCEWPEIYSATRAGDELYGGFCFTFARPHEYERLTDGDAQLADQMRDDVAPYFLPVPLEDRPERVREFARRGLATTIRLPLKSESARGVAVERISNLLSEDVPVHLFLERLRRLEISTVGGDEADATTAVLSRDAMAVEGPTPDPGQRYEYVELGQHGSWFIASRRMPAAEMRDAIAESVAEDQLDESWAAWSHDAWVSVAVRSDGEPVRPRLYTFLPMERGAAAPLHGHIHAPFSTMLARTSVSETVVLNARLLDCAARAAVGAITAFRDNEDVLTDVALVDLLAWEIDHYERVTDAFAATGEKPEEIQFIPIEECPDGRRRGALNTAFAWTYDDVSLIDGSRLARAAGAEIVAPTIAGSRLDRLDEYRRCFFEGVGLSAPSGVRAEWAEKIAADLRSRDAKPRTWDRFYADLVRVFGDDPAALRGRAILLGTDGGLHASPPDDDEHGDHPLVFFSPPREKTDEDDEVEGDVDLRPPASLRRALVLMSDELTWTRREGRGRPSTPARRFLEQNKLVRRFRTADLLEHVGRALQRDGRAALAADALRFSYGLFTATRSIKQSDLRTLGLRVPTRGGWRRADEALFSPEWGTPLAPALTEFIERAGPVAPDVAALDGLLLADPTKWGSGITDVAGWRKFLVEIGVQDGLWPRPVPHGADGQEGQAVNPAGLGRRFQLAEVDRERWQRAVAETPGWQPNHPYTPYRPRDAVAVLPGQAALGEFDQQARRLFAELIAAGLSQWPEGALRVTWYRYNHPRAPDERAWPSPIAAFLAEAPWVPIADPGQRRDVSFVEPGDAWFFAETRGEEPPTFSPLVVARVRRLMAQSDRARSRIRALGIGDWEEPSHAPRLLRHLASLVDEGGIRETGMLAFRRAYVAAWSRTATLDADTFSAGANDLRVVVSRGGELCTLDADADEGAVYLLGDEDSLRARVLAGSQLPVLTVEPDDEPAIHELLTRLLSQDVITADELDIDVLTDDGEFAPDGGLPYLVRGGAAWLEQLLTLILETKQIRTGQIGPRRRADAVDKLLRTRLVLTKKLELRVGGESVSLSDSHRDVAPVDDARYPTLILRSADVTPEVGLPALILLAQPLCELLGISQYDAQLILALERLKSRAIDMPTDDDFASVLDLESARVAEVRSHLGGSVARVVRALIPWVAYCVGADRAMELQGAQDSIRNEEELLRALGEIAPDLEGAPTAITAARDAESPAALRNALGLEYGRFNRALRDLPGYEAIHNREGHRQALAHHAALKRTQLSLELRRRYLSAFRGGGPLGAYVAARTLQIAPDDAWLDDYDLPTDELLDARCREWLEGHGNATSATVNLDDVDLLRTRNRANVQSVAESAQRLVPAWARKNRAPIPAVWGSEEPSETVVEAAVAAGVLDFELLTGDAVLAWLARTERWPAEMPLTISADGLGLSDADMESEADAQERDRQERLRKSRLVTLDGVEVSAEAKNYAAIYEHVVDSLREETIAGRRAAHLVEMPDPTSRRRGDRDGAGGGSRRHRESMSQSQKSAVGLIGEAVAYQWLMRHYPDVCSPACWVSSYRETIGEPPGDDTLGYDFRVELKQTTIFFEVKATKGDDTRFELGESEVRKASECARRRRDEYRVLFITNALDADARDLHVLRNPMDASNAAFYGFPGSGLICTFRLA